MAKGVPLAGTLEDFTNDEGVMRTFFVYDPDGILCSSTRPGRLGAGHSGSP